VAFTHKGLSGIVTHPVDIVYPSPFPAYVRQMVAEITDLAPDWPLRPLVYPDERDEREADEVWRALAPASTESVIACFLASRQPLGVWPPERFAKVLRETVARRPARIVLFGGPADAALLDRMSAIIGEQRATRVVGVGLLALVRILARCALVVSTDSGPRHLANAAGVPVVFVRNLNASRIETGSYCNTEYDMAGSEEWVSRERQGTAFESVRAEAMIERILGLLARARQAS
jgi:ADP-heptose:LPS heptosyltransferase